jgi:hypothetical protein
MRLTIAVASLGLAAAGLFADAESAKAAGNIAAIADAPELASYQRTGSFENCLTATRIRYTKILNSRQILFEMIDKTTYLNEPDACPGLNGFVTLAYDATPNLLCNTTVVHLVEPSSDVPSRGGCNLGRFQKLKLKGAAQ